MVVHEGRTINQGQTEMLTPRIDWIHLDVAQSAPRVGDIVSAAAGGLPIYRVVALIGPEAWVQDEDHVAIQRLPLSRLHWKASEDAASEPGQFLANSH
jgi:hypothetical protein